jgi:hypothetical protein
LAIVTQELVSGQFWGSQILPCVYQAQRGFGA